MKAPSILALLAAGAALAQAQTPPPPPLPPGPVVARAPEMAAWEVTIEDAASGTGNGSGPKAAKTVVSVTKTGAIRKEERVDPDGQRVIRWCAGATQFVLRPGWTEPLRLTGPDYTMIYPDFQQNYVSYAQTDFPECGWISAANYAGTERVEGRDCLVFRDVLDAFSKALLGDARSGPGRDAAVEQIKVDALARIDLQTRLPVFMSKGARTYTYRSLPPPGQVLVLPQGLQSEMKQEDQRQRDLARKPVQS